MVHAHMTAWFVTLILFLVILFLQKQGKNTKVLHMVLRVLYIVTLITGCILFFSVYSITFLYVLKAVFGVWMIALFEMILVRGGKGNNTQMLWIQFAFMLVILLYLGFKLPIGTYLFS